MPPQKKSVNVNSDYIIFSKMIAHIKTNARIYIIQGVDKVAET